VIQVNVVLEYWQLNSIKLKQALQILANLDLMYTFKSKHCVSLLFLVFLLKLLFLVRWDREK
jgi:hypothetical protein